MTHVSLTIKAFDLIVVASAFVFNSLVLGLDWTSLAVAVGGSFSGAVILAYFRRDPRKGEQAFKSLCAAIGGLVIGATLEEYFQITSAKYTLGLYFICGLLSLVMLRALLNLTERNAAEVCKDIIQRIFNLKLADEKDRRSRRQRHRRRHDDNFLTPRFDEKDDDSRSLPGTK